MKKTNYSYVGISFIILLFGIYAVPKIVKHFQKADLFTYQKVPDFSFTNQNGKTITNKDLEGKVYVVEFFFSTCTTICPIMKNNMLRVQNEFIGNPDFGIVSISINPTVDTPKVLKDYAERSGITHKNWHLLTGQSNDYVFGLSEKGFKLPAGIDTNNVDGLLHTGYFALVDKEGNIRCRYDENKNPILYYRGIKEQNNPPQIPELKQDIKLLLNE